MWKLTFLSWRTTTEVYHHCPTQQQIITQVVSSMNISPAEQDVGLWVADFESIFITCCISQQCPIHYCIYSTSKAIELAPYINEWIKFPCYIFIQTVLSKDKIPRCTPCQKKFYSSEKLKWSNYLHLLCVCSYCSGCDCLHRHAAKLFTLCSVVHASERVINHG